MCLLGVSASFAVCIVFCCAFLLLVCPVFDEPTTGLDPIMANVINDLIIKIREELGATTIAITHDMNSVRRIARDIVTGKQIGRAHV